MRVWDSDKEKGRTYGTDTREWDRDKEHGIEHMELIQGYGIEIRNMG